MNDLIQTIPGFKASAVAAGLKKNNQLDLALIFSDRKAAAAGVFTTNAVKAAPVIVCREHIRKREARAIVANAGNANACTGAAGLRDARRTAELAAEALDLSTEEVLVSSTGVIGENLNMSLIQGAMPGLVEGLAPGGISLAAQAIMTTDSFPKLSRFDGHMGGSPFSILGIAKGAGMIMPDMATMLCFILTDARVDAVELERAVLSSAGPTFNRISVDGDTSTNDMVLALANGAAGNRVLNDTDYEVFRNGLYRVMGELARMIVKDGEGATKLVHIEVLGAHTPSDALKAARAVANSSLVKTSFYGQDPNWGRIMAAIGRSGVVMEESRVDIWIDDIQIVDGGLGAGRKQEKKAKDRMALEGFKVVIDLHQGPHGDHITTCDLTHNYVSINADYRT